MQKIEKGINDNESIVVFTSLLIIDGDNLTLDIN